MPALVKRPLQLTQEELDYIDTLEEGKVKDFLKKHATKQVVGLLARAAFALGPQKIHAGEYAKKGLPPSKPAASQVVKHVQGSAGGKPPFRQGPHGEIITDSVARLQRHRFLRDEILPELELALEDTLTEAGRLKKFATVIRALSVLAAPPSQVANLPDAPPQVAVQGESPASKAPHKILAPSTGQGGSPPKKKTGPQAPAGQRSPR